MLEYEPKASPAPTVPTVSPSAPTPTATQNDDDDDDDDDDGFIIKVTTQEKQFFNTTDIWSRHSLPAFQ
jgi:hypothetical protein